MTRDFSRIVPWLVFGLLAAHVAIASWNLGTRPLWVDEACSALFARSSVPQIIHTLKEDCGMPLHYLLLKGVRSAIGESEAVLRAPSVFFSAAAGLLIWLLGKRLAGDWAGLFGVLMWISSPATIRMAREARCYTLFACLSIGLFFAWHYWADRPSVRRLILPVVLHVLAAYLHNFGLMLFPAAFAMVIWMKGRKAILPLAAVIVVWLILYSPWISVLLMQLGRTQQSIGWVERTWSPLSPLLSLALFGFGAHRPVYLGLPPVWDWVSMIGVLLVVWPVLLFVWSWRKHSHLLPLLIFVFVYLLVPYAYSWLFRPIDLPGRTDFPVFPLLCVVIGCGVVRMGRFRWFWGALVLLLGVIWSVAFLSPERGYNDRETAALVDRWTDSDDIVICTGLSRPSMEYYLYRSGHDRPDLVSFPDTTRMGYLEESIYLYDTARLREQHRKLIDRIRESIMDRYPDQRILVVLTPRRINDGLIELLEDAGFGQPRDLPSGRIGLSRIDEPCQLVLFQSLG